jgi:hypothetical protein
MATQLRVNVMPGILLVELDEVACALHALELLGLCSLSLLGRSLLELGTKPRDFVLILLRQRLVDIAFFPQLASDFLCSRSPLRLGSCFGLNLLDDFVGALDALLQVFVLLQNLAVSIFVVRWSLESAG